MRSRTPPNATGGGFCGACGTPMRVGDRFCRRCGASRPSVPEAPAAGIAFDDRTTVLPLDEMLDDTLVDAAHPPIDISPEQPPRLSAGRRVTSFGEFQWLVLATAVVIAVFINAVGLWLARAGRAAGEENIAAGVTTYIFDNLQAFKSALTGLAVILAALAVFSMRAAIIDNRNLPLATYVKLRRYHRLVGYGAAAVAFAVGLLTCVGIFGFGTDSPRSVLHSILGAALLVALVAKIAVVRYFPAQRRYLKLLGEGVLVLFILVFASSVVPFLWEQFSGGSNGYYYGR